jgi:NAD+ kinase
MRPSKAISFRASSARIAREALAELTAKFGQCPAEDADVVVALGGDGFMLETLKDVRPMDKPVYGMNRGTVGFLMNEYSEEDLPERLAQAEEAATNPLRMDVGAEDGAVTTARLKVSVDGRTRIEELVCDGALVATPAGSTAYNYSAYGPILPIGSEVLALTAVAPFRPRRWRGALLPKSAVVRFDVLEREKRPVMADADGQPVRHAHWVEIRSEPAIQHRILFDPGHGLEERLISEQFL